jgi:hypothetical protein
MGQCGVSLGSQYAWLVEKPFGIRDLLDPIGDHGRPRSLRGSCILPEKIDIVVQEIREQENLAVSEHVIQTPYSFAKNTNEVKKEPNTTTQQKIDNQNSEHVPENTCVSESEVQSEDESEEDESEEDESEEDESEEDESEVQPEEESEVQPEEDESEVQPKDESEVQPEEEEIELNLEPVRIKKILYWKDSDNGDLYTYLPNDEVGDKIGALIRPIDI